MGLSLLRGRLQVQILPGSPSPCFGADNSRYFPPFWNLISEVGTFCSPSVCDNAFYFRGQAPLRVIEAGTAMASSTGCSTESFPDCPEIMSGVCNQGPRAR